jgi:hypothetical protein
MPLFTRKAIRPKKKALKDKSIWAGDYRQKRLGFNPRGVREYRNVKNENIRGYQLQTFASPSGSRRSYMVTTPATATKSGSTKHFKSYDAALKFIDRHLTTSHSKMKRR